MFPLLFMGALGLLIGFVCGVMYERLGRRL